MINREIFLQTLILFISFILFYPSRVFASGFFIYTQGARELGLLNAVVAHSEGPASNFFNPALLTELSGTQLEIGTTLIFPDREFSSSSTGETTEEDSETFFPSTIYLAHKFNERFSGGIGFFSSNGLGTDWPDDWEGRYLTTFSEMMSFSVNPNLAWKILDNLSVAGGIDLLWSEATLKRKINLLPLGLSDGNQRFEGDGTAWGINLGVFYSIADRVSLGIAYRSKMDLELNGDVKFNMPPGTPPIFTNTDGEVDVDLPAQITFGISCLITDKLLVEFDARWEEWSRFESLEFQFKQTPVAGGSDTLIEEKKWDNTWTYMLGAKYYFSPTIEFAMGYLYGNNPAPDETFEPSIPVTDHNMLSFGINKLWGKYSLALTYLYGWYDNRTKDNSVGEDTGSPANGKYEQSTQMLSTSLKIDF